jgi:hypothetical protein
LETLCELATVAHGALASPLRELMKRCCVCKNPSFDDAARAPLCEVCTRLLAEHELSEGEKFATRTLTAFMQRMRNAGLGERMGAMLQALDSLSQQELDGMSEEEAVAYVPPMTTEELSFAFGTLMDLMVGVAAGESA